MRTYNCVQMNDEKTITFYMVKQAAFGGHSSLFYVHFYKSSAFINVCCYCIERCSLFTVRNTHQRFPKKFEFQKMKNEIKTETETDKQQFCKHYIYILSKYVCCLMRIGKIQGGIVCLYLTSFFFMFSFGKIIWDNENVCCALYTLTAYEYKSNSFIQRFNQHEIWK